MNIITTYFKTPIGELIIGSFGGELCLCDWRYRKMRNQIDQRIQKGLDARYEEGGSEINQETIQQLTAYFQAERSQFDIPLKLVGTDFQQKVWQQLIRIPFGETSSYLELSRDLGNEKAIRAVASANGANAISIIVPCHRIIGSDGKLVGYAGGLDAKKKLLRLENPENYAQQLSLF
ncbi:methylated-DNA--[protein]-cysteine S-methyltransferase [Saccharicrinis sp. GN24d3]|uniref:methylated-DNA--[protein]-cysteine S-methyltransferase n=1 Tax=Saccharicrinis sp. GN24d3 TaxID=3458416 RepID=UPI0040352374